MARLFSNLDRSFDLGVLPTELLARAAVEPIVGVRQPEWASANWYRRWENRVPSIWTQRSSHTVKSERHWRPGGCSWAK